jgi:hypothetical protein
MAFGGPQGTNQKQKTISAYHEANGLVKHSQLEAYYRTLTAGVPSHHGLNDMIRYAWRNGLAP